jgi:AbrB family looped-hinge helix DNA binding protein
VIDNLFVGQAEIRTMSTVTLSTKFQVVIPKRIREALELKPGQKLQALVFDGRIELIPLREMAEMRGFVKGIETDVPREADRL